jgi:hypothetical protein
MGGSAFAAQRDAEKMDARVPTQGTKREKVDELEAVSDWDESSRGGTRTLDPGIMSAVL